MSIALSALHYFLFPVLPILSVTYVITLMVSLGIDLVKHIQKKYFSVDETAPIEEEVNEVETVDKTTSEKEVASEPKLITQEDYETLIKAGYKAHPLYLRGYEHDESLSLEDFLKKLLAVYSLRCDTTYADGTLQSEAGYRSLGDILMICAPLYPGVTRLQVKQALVNMRGLVGHICPDIRRRVYCHKDVREGWNLNHKGRKDEFGETLWCGVVKPDFHENASIYD